MHRGRRTPAVVLVAIIAIAIAGCSGSSDGGAPPASTGSAVASPESSSSPSAYAAATEKITSDYGVTFRRMGTLVGNPAFDSATWRQNVADVVASVKALGERLRALTPPECLSEVHAAQLDGAVSYDQMADLLALGVANANDAAFLESATYLAQGNDAIARAATLLSAARC